MTCYRQAFKFALICIILLTNAFLDSTNNIYAQNITKRVRVVSGGSVSFIFKSLVEYSSGKTLSYWSRLNIQFQDTTDAGGDGTSTGWKLMVRANSSAIQSDGAAADIPLSFIHIRPTTLIPGTTVTNIVLTDANQTIVQGGDPGALTVTGEIVITYDCGTTTPLLGREPDYYFVDLIFTLAEIP